MVIFPPARIQAPIQSAREGDGVGKTGVRLVERTQPTVEYCLRSAAD